MARRLAPLLFLLSLLPGLSGAELTDSRRDLIRSLFPAATMIEDKLPDFPVYPVYQLQELLGYAYESTDSAYARSDLDHAVGDYLELRLAGRCRPGRAESADRFCRSAGHRTNSGRDIAGGISEFRVFTGPRRDRHDR